VALKILPPEVGRDPHFAERFTREARALAKLSHPNIVMVYEFGQSDGLYYLIMEFVDGVNLRQTIRSGTLGPAEALKIVPQICEALQFAHEEGVVHRDIKPENVQVTDSEPRAKLMDFGIARLADEVSLTAAGDVVGTLAYMSPEQAEGREAGPEADVYSLALTLYECWSGENPHRRATPAATARAIGSRARSLRKVRPDLPREMSDQIDACLSARPSRRPSLEELGTAIEDALEELAEELPGSGRRHLTPALLAPALLAAIAVFLLLGHGAL
jgi:serine/threonine protein kinase